MKEKQEAARKAKLLEEMDKLIEEQSEQEAALVVQRQPNKKYTAVHLKGMRIEHDEAMFKEEQEVILTLKDRAILKGRGEDLNLDEDEDGDVLVNVNFMDDERAKKNIENRKKKPDYKPYDDDFDEDGNVIFS